MNYEDKFPNGFTSWQETHFEIVSNIMNCVNTRNEEDYPRLIGLTITMQGTGGLYELAENLTDKFEKENTDREWDGEFYDVIEEFLTNELK